MKPIALVAALLAAAPLAAAAPPSIPNGTYRCHTGSGQLTLALGDVAIAGPRYVLTDPNRRQTGGTYTITPLGYRWSGDFGAVRHDQLADSGPDPVGGGFIVRYALGHTSPVSIVCRRA